MSPVGPYNTPLALARTPIAAIFWPLIAPLLFLYFGALLIGFFTFGWAFGQFGEDGTLGGQWIIVTLCYFLALVAMTLWAERIGAGPFAGEIRLDGDALALSILTGPVVLWTSMVLMGLLVGADGEDWVFRDGADTSLISRAALGPLMLVYTIILAPLFEEIAFRGIALGCLLARGWPPLFAGVLTSAAFAAMHLQYTLAAMVPVFTMGLYLAWLRVQTGTVAAPIVAHISANFVSMLVFIFADPPA